MNARDWALVRLDELELPRWHAGKQREAVPPTDPRDLALAEQITVGVVKNLLHLQFLIEHYSGRKLKSIDPLVQKILAIALYQMRFLTRIPASAAVDQAVGQTRRFARASSAGFVNAVLRNVGRMPEPPIPSADDDVTEHARLALSHPPELFSKLADELGIEQALSICRHDNAEPPTILRLALGVDVSQLAADGISILPHERAGMAVVHPARRSLLADWSQRGLAQVQDPTAAEPVRYLDVHPGQSILDRCCGLGTKTLQIRDLLGDAVQIHAVDPSDVRTRTLQSLLAARGIANVLVHRAAFLRDLPGRPAAFDRVLVDVPCGNSGVMARRPESRYHQTRAALASLATLQRDILDDTAPAVAPGGLLIYSTCSIWPEENEEQVKSFLQRHKDFTHLDERTTLPFSDDNPGHYHDGGYFAVLRRA